LDKEPNVVVKEFNLLARFWTTHTHTITIAAKVGDVGTDWAAYMNAENNFAVGSQNHSVVRAILFGAKLSEKDGRHFFPDINLPYRE